MLLVAVLNGCVAMHTDTTPDDLATVVSVDAPAAEDDDVDWSSDDPSVTAMFRKITDTALGTPYVRGGTGPSGFDCSGFVQWTFRNMGVTVPRTAREQSTVGRRVAMEDMRVGDIVAFRHPKRGHHTGIYMGDGQFVHSPSKRKQVRYSSMQDPYFSTTFIGARRVDLDKEIDIDALTDRMALAKLEKAHQPSPSSKAQGTASKKSAKAQPGKATQTKRMVAAAPTAKKSAKPKAASTTKTPQVAQKTQGAKPPAAVAQVAQASPKSQAAKASPTARDTAGKKAAPPATRQGTAVAPAQKTAAGNKQAPPAQEGTKTAAAGKNAGKPAPKQTAPKNTSRKKG